MIKRFIQTSFLFLGLCVVACHASAEERILDFHSNIKIGKNGDMTVREALAFSSNVFFTICSK